MEKGKHYPHVQRFDRTEAARLYAEGKSTVQVGALLGVTARAVRLALIELGVELRTIGQARNAAAKERRVNAYGYVMIRVGPRKYRLEHRMIVERVIGRPLKRTEYVHHINCNRGDNRNENLLVCSHEYHNSLHDRMRKHPYWSQLNP